MHFLGELNAQHSFSACEFNAASQIHQKCHNRVRTLLILQQFTAFNTTPLQTFNDGEAYSTTPS
jgi:hypothetical protein